MLVSMALLIATSSMLIHDQTLLSCERDNADTTLCRDDDDVVHIVSIIVLVLSILGLLYSGYSMYNTFGGAAKVDAGRAMLNSMKSRARPSAYGLY